MIMAQYFVTDSSKGHLRSANFFIKNFRSKWDRNTAWMSMCLSHQEASIDSHGLHTTHVKNCPCPWPEVKCQNDRLKSYITPYALTRRLRWYVLKPFCTSVSKKSYANNIFTRSGDFLWPMELHPLNVVQVWRPILLKIVIGYPLLFADWL